MTLSGDDDKKGDGDDEKAGMGPVYRIGKHKFRLDGKDGKTLDDIIEVQGVRTTFGCEILPLQHPTYRVSKPIVREISSCFVLGVPLPCLGSS